MMLPMHLILPADIQMDTLVVSCDNAKTHMIYNSSRMGISGSVTSSSSVLSHERSTSGASSSTCGEGMTSYSGVQSQHRSASLERSSRWGEASTSNSMSSQAKQPSKSGQISVDRAPVLRSSRASQSVAADFSCLFSQEKLRFKQLLQREVLRRSRGSYTDRCIQ
mmetsp:Transcript_13962/g.18204  ORF Transcript_13962/g.18204 Transcript_13962/m.18204 type:complete len:165 (-) Transcript_13962:47-541(-)